MSDSAPQDEWLPLFPLNTVLFPEGMLPLRVFEARYMDMTRDCLKRRRPFGVCLIREGREVGAPAMHLSIGCLAEIIECDMQQLGVLHVLTRGGQRFRVLETRVNNQGLISARTEAIAAEEDAAIPEECSACVKLLKVVIAERGEDIFLPPHRFDSASWVSHRLAEILPLPLPARQQLLEMSDPGARLGLVQKYLRQQGIDP